MQYKYETKHTAQNKTQHRQILHSSSKFIAACQNLHLHVSTYMKHIKFSKTTSIYLFFLSATRLALVETIITHNACIRILHNLHILHRLTQRCHWLRHQHQAGVH